LRFEILEAQISGEPKYTLDRRIILSEFQPLDHSKVEGQDKLGKGRTNLSGRESGTQIYARQGISDPLDLSSFNRGGGGGGGGSS
jgi:hypothetical protein